jgi:hypothetical protein
MASVHPPFGADEIDLDGGVFRNGNVNGICRLEGKQQSEEKEGHEGTIPYSVSTTVQSQPLIMIEDYGSKDIIYSIGKLDPRHLYKLDYL